MEKAAAPGTVPAAAADADIDRMYMWDLGCQIPFLDKRQDRR